MNLFWSTRALTQSKEDHLTEFFTAALTLNEHVRNAYTELVFDSYAQANGWRKPVIEKVETQVVYEGTNCNNCCPDMRLTLTDGHIIICENKIDALETRGSEPDDRLQLERYLDLPIDGLIYVRSSWKCPNQGVLENPKYIRPPEKELFLWRDFYNIFAQSDDQFIAWVKEGFESLGFTPPHPIVGELSGPDSEENSRNRKNFAKLWGSTRSFANQLGWKVGTGSIVELYLSQSPTSLATDVFISPAMIDRFLFRVTPGKRKLDEVLTVLKHAAKSFRVPIEISDTIVSRKGGKVTVVDVITSLNMVIGKTTQNTTEIERRLLKFVGAFLSALNSSH